MSVIGAVGSLALMFDAGRQTPVLLLVLFVGWILVPFIALFIAYAISKSWSVVAQMALCSLMVILTTGSLICYSGLLDYPGMRPAFMFVLVPVISSLLIAVVILLTRRLTNHQD